MKKKRKKRDYNSIKERVKKNKVPKVLYTITDKYFPAFNVVFSDNAWWTERAKVERLIEAFKIDSGVMEACVYAGITHDQWQYFIEKHPSFSVIRDLVSELPSLQARQTVVKGLSNDKDFALKYLERKRRQEFATQSNSIIGEDKKNPFGANWVEAVKLLVKNKGTVQDVEVAKKDMPKLKDY